jgi:uncharacterized membrane protein YkvA (DUF1232 family)
MRSRPQPVAAGSNGFRANQAVFAPEGRFVCPFPIICRWAESAAVGAATFANELVGWFLVSFGLLVLVWVVAVCALVVAGRRTDARALAGFIPDCLLLMRRLLADPRVPRRRKLLLVGLVGYLALPFDLVPDFIPIAGQLDDVIIVGLVLRSFVRVDGGALVREHSPRPGRSLELVLRAAGVRDRARDQALAAQPRLVTRRGPVIPIENLRPSGRLLRGRDEQA